MDKSQLTDHFKQTALDIGFTKVGIASAKKLSHADYLTQWLKSGHHGTMHWMENYLEKRQDVTKLSPDVKSVVAVAMNYYSPQQHDDNPQSAKISRYAWGKDYHKIMKKKLKQLLREIQKEQPHVEGRICVDTAPIQDKLWAAEAGIGWQGKNTNILSRDYGSWIFLGELILNVDLDYDDPVKDYCGSCTACIEACPTDALKSYKLDATKCISYLTIEMWDNPIPQEYAGKLQNWIFGCDICQDVCPWNRFQKQTSEQDFQPDPQNVNPQLQELEKMKEEQFRKRFKKSPVFRAKYKNFIRNVKTVLKNLV
jgi:epoxyqueuosine reductase